MLWRMRHLVYRGFAQTGSAPAMDALAGQLGIPEREALGLLRELAGRNVIVLTEDGRGVRNANPFSAVPTPVRVTANGVDAWANCAWDMLGVPAATIYATCAVDESSPTP